MFSLMCLAINVFLLKLSNNYNIKKWSLLLQSKQIKHIPKAGPTLSCEGIDGNIRSVMFIIVCRQLSLIFNNVGIV